LLLLCVPVNQNRAVCRYVMSIPKDRDLFVQSLQNQLSREQASTEQLRSLLTEVHQRSEQDLKLHKKPSR